MEVKSLVIGIMVSSVFWAISFDQIMDQISDDHFRIDVKSSFTEGKQQEIVTVENIKGVTLSDVFIKIMSGDQLEIISNSCTASDTSFSLTKSFVTITIKEFSPHQKCRIELSSSVEDDVFSVEMLANDTDRQRWSEFSEGFDIGSMVIMLMLIVFGGVGIIVGYSFFTEKTIDTDSLQKLPVDQELIDKFGHGFNHTDEIIINAINIGNHDVDSIASYTHKPRVYILFRLRKMEKRGMFDFEL